MTRQRQRYGLFVDSSVHWNLFSKFILLCCTAHSKKGNLQALSKCRRNINFSKLELSIFWVAREFLLRFKLEFINTMHASALRNVVSVRKSTGPTTVGCSLSLRSLVFDAITFSRRCSLFITSVRRLLFVTICDARVNILYLFPYVSVVKYLSLQFQSTSEIEFSLIFLFFKYCYEIN